MQEKKGASKQKSDFGKYTIEQAEQLIKLARESIKSKFTNEKVEFPQGKEFMQQRGVFVTLHTFPGKKLRGCIGFPYPNLAIAEAVFQAAQSAAFSDPRFSQLKEEELSEIIIEISILTIPENCITRDIKVGKDGLMCEYIFFSGLLLPQVATEYKMNKIQFLEALCEKAGLPKDSWQKDKFSLKKFQAQVFLEQEPDGKIIEQKS